LRFLLARSRTELADIDCFRANSTKSEITLTRGSLKLDKSQHQLIVPINHQVIKLVIGVDTALMAM